TATTASCARRTLPARPASRITPRSISARTGPAALRSSPEDITTPEGASSSVLVAEAIRTASDGPYRVTLVVGRRVGGHLRAPVRTPTDATTQVDARIVAGTEVLLAPKTKDWDALSQDEPIRIPLLGPEGATVANIEIAVSDRDMTRLLS